MLTSSSSTIQVEPDSLTTRPAHDPHRPHSSQPSSSKSDLKVQSHYNFPGWLIISVWISLSSMVIFYNASILKDWSFPYPVTLTSLHLAFQTLATQILARFSNLVALPTSFNNSQHSSSYNLLPTSSSSNNSTYHEEEGEEQEEHSLIKKVALVRTHQDSNSHQLPTLPPEIFWKKVVPIAVLFSLSLVLSNAVYLYLSVAFIQMIKAASPVAVLLTSIAFGLQSPSIHLFAIVFLISFGIGLASYGEVAFSLIGFLIQVIAILVEANRVVLIQLLLGTGMTPLTSLYFFAPVCLMINLTLIFPLEGFAAFKAIPKLGPWVILSNAALTFLLNLSSVYLIQLSSLILSLSKVLKDLILILGSNLFFNLFNSPKSNSNSIHLIQWFGYLIALIGLIAYKRGI